MGTGSHAILAARLQVLSFFNVVQCTLPSPQQEFLSLLTTWDVYALVPSFVLSFTDFFYSGFETAISAFLCSEATCLTLVWGLIFPFPSKMS